MPAENHKKGTQIKSISFHKTGHPDKRCTIPFQKTSWNAKAHRNFAQTLKKDSFWFVKTESKGQIPNDWKSNRPSEKQKSEPQIPKSRIKIRLYAEKKPNRYSWRKPAASQGNPFGKESKGSDQEEAGGKCKKAVKSRSSKEFVQCCRNGGNQWC